MTIALGILALDGVVIAADSQETVQNYWKSNQGKVWWSGLYTNLKNSRSAGVCAVAGASNRAGYADSLTHRVLKAFGDNPAAEDPEDLREIWESVCAQFHQQNTAPYPDLPDVGLVIGYYRNYKTGLFSTDRGTLIPQSFSAAVGVGAMEAQRALSTMWRLRLGVKEAIVCAAYAAFLAKEHVDGCGNATDIVYMREHRTGAVDRGVVERLEAIFRRYAKYLEMPLLHRVLGAGVPTMPNAGEAVEVLRRDIEGVGITLIDGLKNFDPTARPVRPTPKRGLKVRPPSRG